MAYLIASMELCPGDLYDTTMTDSTEKMEIGTEPVQSTRGTNIRKLQGAYTNLKPCFIDIVVRALV